MSTETKEQRIERIVDRFRADPELQELVRKDLTALCEEMEREKWLPIETAPKDGTRILAFWRNNDAISTIYRDNGRWTDAVNGDEYVIDPTHWQPLPQPPEGKTQ